MIRRGLAALRLLQYEVLADDVTYSRDGAAKAELGLGPEKGDVSWCDGGEYEVLAPNGEPVWRWSDPHRTAMRIHAKHTGGDE